VGCRELVITVSGTNPGDGATGVGSINVILQYPGEIPNFLEETYVTDYDGMDFEYDKSHPHRQSFKFEDKTWHTGEDHTVQFKVILCPGVYTAEIRLQIDGIDHADDHTKKIIYITERCDSTCSYAQVGCEANVVRLRTYIPLSSPILGSGSAVVLKDNNPRSRRLLLLTAGHNFWSEPGSGNDIDSPDNKINHVDFDLEPEECGGSSWEENVYSYRPVDFKILAGEYRGEKNGGCYRDWALFTIEKPDPSILSLSGAEFKTDVVSKGNDVFFIHHPGGDLKRKSEGDITIPSDGCWYLIPNPTGLFKLNDGNFGEPGSSGAPVFDSNDSKGIGIQVAVTDGGDCVQNSIARFTLYNYIYPKIKKYINPTQVDSNLSCDTDLCYATINEALQRAQDDTTVMLSGGAFSEDIVLNENKFLFLLGGNVFSGDIDNKEMAEIEQETDSTVKNSSSFTKIHGSLRVSKGTIAVENIVLSGKTP